MEKGTIRQIEKNYFGVGYTSQYAGEDISRDSPSLTAYSFAGLFTITGFLTILALVCSECSVAISKHRKRGSSKVTEDDPPENNPQVPEDDPPKNNPQDPKNDEILEQLGEGHEQEVLQEPRNVRRDEQEVELTNANIGHGGG